MGFSKGFSGVLAASGMFQCVAGRLRGIPGVFKSFQVCSSGFGGSSVVCIACLGNSGTLRGFSGNFWGVSGCANGVPRDLKGLHRAFHGALRVFQVVSWASGDFPGA